MHHTSIETKTFTLVKLIGVIAMPNKGEIYLGQFLGARP